MSDEFMFSAWRRPPPEFARQLRTRLAAVPVHRRGWMPGAAGLRVAACAAALVAALSLLTVPQVWAGARAFLDMFRVVSVRAVPVPRDRLEALFARQGTDLPRLLGEQMRVEQAPGPVQKLATPTEAAQLAGLTLRMPAWLPVGLTVREAGVLGEQRFRVTVSTSRLEQLLTSQGITDLTVPAGLDGQEVKLHIPALMWTVYGGAASPVVLVEAHQPEVSLPAGMDVQQMAELTLRVLGIDREQAYRLAQEIDWRTTLVVPVPADVASFQQVNVRGAAGLLIKSSARAGTPSAQLLWSSGDTVFALIGRLPADQLLEMAQSTQ